MLNLFNLKLNNNNNNNIKKQVNRYKIKQKRIQHFTPAVREWNSSIYTFNKNTSNLIPISNKLITRLINNYLNMYNKKLESKIRRRRIGLKSRRLSTHRVFISKGEFKHTNNKAIINIYVYNKQKFNYLYKISKKKEIKKYGYGYGRKKTKIMLIKDKKYNLIKKLLRKNYIKKNILLKNNLLIKKSFWEKKELWFYIKNIYLRKNFLKQLNLNRIIKIIWALKKRKRKRYKISYFQKIEKYKEYLKKKRNISFYNKFIRYKKNIFIRKLFKKFLKRHIINTYYKRLLIINELKFKYTYLNKLINLLNKIYNKTIELNIINLKYFYLNSSIYTEFVTNKILKKRKKLNRILKKSVRKVRIIKKKNIEHINNISKLSKYKLLQINNIKKILKEKNKLNIYNKINKIYKKNFSKYKIKYKILNSINNKNITGVWLKATGRLSKRHTASRSLHRLRYKGSLINIHNKKNELSLKMVRGTFKPNIQYTNLNSTVRTGSFGIKGWISNN